MESTSNTRIVRCWHCKGMMKIPARALSVFCPHCQKRASMEDLVIVGSHPGKSLMTCGDIRVEQPAKLHVELFGNKIVILGRVKGNVTANVGVEVGPTGHVIGDIKAPRIVVAEGGVIDGRCEMTRPVTLVSAAVVETVEAPSEPAAKPEPVINMPRPRPLAPPKR